MQLTVRAPERKEVDFFLLYSSLNNDVETNEERARRVSGNGQSWRSNCCGRVRRICKETASSHSGGNLLRLLESSG